MKKKAEGIITILCGLICIAAALFVYFIGYTIYPNSDSSGVQDLNWLLATFGKIGTAVLFAIPALISVYSGIRKLSGIK